MDNWYSLSLGDGITAGMPTHEIEERFLQVINITGRPLDMAVFTRPESEGRLHCEIIAYFSPATTALAKEFGAQPCEKPTRAGLGLLAGNEESWSVLFPDHA